MKPFVITSILAPTDLSDSNLPALRYARLFADRFAAKLTVMYAEPILYPLDPMMPGGAFVAPTVAERQRLQADLEKHAATVMEGRPYTIDIAVGQPIPAILFAAKQCNADLMIMGTHLRHGWRRALLGSVSDGVLHASECPVLTVASHDQLPGAKPFAITNVLCPVNFTDVARDSLHVAARLAEAFGAHLTIVHVLEPDEPMNVAADEERVRQWIDPDLQDVCAYHELVLRGGPAERVLDAADDLGADFLVIGAQHKRFRDTTVVGTTTDRLIRFASSPVLVVPRAATPHTAEAEKPAMVLEHVS